MARIAFRDWRPSQESLDLVETCNGIIEELSQYKLTLRQLYYQLVVKNIITNEEKSYKKLGTLLMRARMAGLVDWNAIEDRVRVPVLPPEFDNLKDLVDAAVRSYRLPRWRDQETYAELWVEKDALASVLRPLALQDHVVLMVNRGYSSASAMYGAAQRFIQEQNEGKELHLFYLGDLDPSGEDMVRDIRSRLMEFNAFVHVDKIALTYEQVQQYDPPPNPAKLTDTRAKDFIERYGTDSWEVDALPPAVLQELIREAIGGVLDRDKMQETIDQEGVDKSRLLDFVEDI